MRKEQCFGEEEKGVSRYILPSVCSKVNCSELLCMRSSTATHETSPVQQLPVTRSSNNMSIVGVLSCPGELPLSLTLAPWVCVPSGISIA